MAHFKVEVQRSLSKISSFKAKKNGIVANILGRSIGVSVSAFYDRHLKHDVFIVYMTEGKGSEIKWDHPLIIVHEDGTVHGLTGYVPEITAGRNRDEDGSDKKGNEAK